MSPTGYSSTQHLRSFLTQVEKKLGRCTLEIYSFDRHGLKKLLRSIIRTFVSNRVYQIIVGVFYTVYLYFFAFVFPLFSTEGGDMLCVV